MSRYYHAIINDDDDDDDDDYILPGALLDSEGARGLTESRGTYEHHAQRRKEKEK